MKKTNNLIQNIFAKFFLILFGFLFLIMFIFFIQNSNMFDSDKKTEKNQSKQPSSLLTNNKDISTTAGEPFEYSQFFIPAKKLAKNNEIFMPTTIDFPIFNALSSPITNQAEDSKKQFLKQKLITITGGKKNDIYLIGFYDQMVAGGFGRSQNLKIIPSEENSESYLNITLQLSSADAGSIIQVPICLKGVISNSFSHNLDYTLTTTGSLKILSFPNQNEKTYLNYTVKRAKKPLQIHPSTNISPWLKKEFKQIPKKILKLLQETKQKPKNTRLTLVAAILNTQFAYQTQQRQITKPTGKTWNHLLKESLETGDKLSADCDVLSTFAYIYLKFLDINPVFIIGYFNLLNPNHLEGNELHATLYLTNEGKPLLFEPTIFTEQTLSEQPKNKKKNKIEKNTLEIDYFFPSQKIWDKFQQNKKTDTNLPLDKAWEKIKNDQPKQQKPKRKSLSMQFIYQLASLILLFSLVILAIILYIRSRAKKKK